MLSFTTVREREQPIETVRGCVPSHRRLGAPFGLLATPYGVDCGRPRLSRFPCSSDRSPYESGLAAVWQHLDRPCRQLCCTIKSRVSACGLDVRSPQTGGVSVRARMNRPVMGILGGVGACKPTRASRYVRFHFVGQAERSAEAATSYGPGRFNRRECSLCVVERDSNHYGWYCGRKKQQLVKPPLRGSGFHYEQSGVEALGRLMPFQFVSPRLRC
jgi:hypothetical protein